VTFVNRILQGVLKTFGVSKHFTKSYCGFRIFYYQTICGVLSLQRAFRIVLMILKNPGRKASCVRMWTCSAYEKATAQYVLHQRILENEQHKTDDDRFISKACLNEVVSKGVFMWTVNTIGDIPPCWRPVTQQRVGWRQRLVKDSAGSSSTRCTDTNANGRATVRLTTAHPYLSLCGGAVYLRRLTFVTRLAGKRSDARVW